MPNLPRSKLPGSTTSDIHRQTLRVSQHRRPAGPDRDAGLCAAGDTVVVTAIDRLGRSVAEVTRTIADR
jgi:hypothetical protein